MQTLVPVHNLLPARDRQAYLTKTDVVALQC